MSRKHKPVPLPILVPSPLAGRDWGLLGACALLHLSLAFAFIRSAAPTYDEPIHVAAGWSYWATGRYRLNINDHPPLAEMISATPLALLRPSFSDSHPLYQALSQYPFAFEFLYRNRVDAERLLLWARSFGLLVWTALLLGGAAAWALALAGAPAAVASAAVFALMPVFLSNNALVTTDSAGAAFFFLTFLALARAHADREPRLRDFALAGLFSGLALASKFNAILIPPLALVLAAWEARRGGDWRRYAKNATAFLCAAAAIVAIVYRFSQLPLWWGGMSAVLGKMHGGKPSWALGHHSTEGFWWYFPLAFLVKTPIAALVLAACGLAFARQTLRPGAAWLLVPPAVYFVSALAARFQIGVRHLLPVYPFLVVLAGLGAAALWRRGGRARWAAGLLLSWQAGSTLRVHPHQLAYYNELAGGPAGGHRVLVDSNLDWGQALKPLARWLAEQGNPPIFLGYFGTADPAYYGIRYAPAAPPLDVPFAGTGDDPAAADRVLLAVSATHLSGVYLSRRDAYAWLQNRRPVWTAGHAIFVYDLTEDRDGLIQLARLSAGISRMEQAMALARRAQNANAR